VHIQSYLDALKADRIPLAAGLAIVSNYQGVRAIGFVYENGNVFSVDRLSLPGPVMERLPVEALWPLTGPTSSLPLRAIRNGRHALPRPSSRTSNTNRNTRNKRLNRLAAFLGDGNLAAGGAILRKAWSLRVAVLGCGRMGSALLHQLAQCGVGSEGRLTGIDGDVVEDVNLDVMPLPPSAIGMPKAEAAARMSYTMGLPTQVHPLIATLSDSVAVETVAASDVVFTCVDREAPRVGASALAARYCRVHIDLAAGAAFTSTGDSAWGAEVRVSVPGSRGCVACFGTKDWDEARDELAASPGAEHRQRFRNDPLAERPGSSAAMIVQAIGAGMREFWRLLRGQRRSSAWLHLNANEDVPLWQDWTRTRRQRACRACSASGLEGLGDWRENMHHNVGGRAHWSQIMGHGRSTPDPGQRLEDLLFQVRSWFWQITG